MRIASPPTTDPCYYGVDTPSKEELLAAKHDLDGMREFIGADSLGFLSLDGLYRSVQCNRGKFCDACFSGEYPMGKPDQHTTKKQLELL